LNTADDLW